MSLCPACRTESFTMEHGCSFCGYHSNPNRHRVARFWKALETIYPELANGQKIQEIAVTEDPPDLSQLPKKFLSVINIRIVYGYDQEAT